VSAAAGPHASGWVSALLALSTLGALHVQLLSVPRVFFAMAHDRLLPAVFGRVHPATRAPVATIVTFAAIACVLALLGNFDLLMNMAGFGYLIFYALTVLGLLRILLQQPHAWQPRRIGRLAVAVVFLAGTSWLLVRIIASAHAEIIAALVLMAAGLPAYLLAQRLRRGGGAQAAFTR
jgi:basic amino acid/polyamine antiporter, APA family